MSKTVTAIFRTADIANLVKTEIEKLGVPGRHIEVIGGANTDDRIGYLGLPNDEAVTYRQAVREGHYVVSAEVDADKTGQVAEIMRHPEHGVDIDAYEETYRSSETYQSDLTDYGTAYGASATAVEGETSIPVAEERIAVGKREVEGGTTHVRTYVHEVPVEERIRLREERVSVERQATGERVVAPGEADALFQERDIAVTERDEEALVAKEAVVTEEVVVRKDVGEREEIVTDTVRKTEVDVDKT